RSNRGNPHEARAYRARRHPARHRRRLFSGSCRPAAELLTRLRGRCDARSCQARHCLRRGRPGADRSRHLHGTEMSGKAGAMAPLRMSRRVMNLAYMLTQNARRHGDRIGFVWGEKSWTWRQIDNEVSALAAALSARGIEKGDRILVHSKNGEEMFWSMFAAFRLGAVWVPTNFRLMPDEVAYLATASGAKAFLCHGDFPEHAAAVKSPSLTFLWRMGGEGAFGETSVRAAIAAQAGAAIENAAVEYDDPCWFFFTSGTTGRSKAAVLTHGQMGFVVTNHLADLTPGTTEHDASLVVAPLSHGAGVHQLMQTARGARTVLLPSEKF